MPSLAGRSSRFLFGQRVREARGKIPMLVLSAAIALFFAFSIPTGALADESAIEETETEATVGKMALKLGRGLVNILTGWLEIPVQVYKTSANEGVLSGISLGLLKGVGMTVVRTGAGAVETAMFLMPFPGDYKPLLKPEFVWSSSLESESVSALMERRAFLISGEGIGEPLRTSAVGDIDCAHGEEGDSPLALPSVALGLEERRWHGHLAHESRVALGSIALGVEERAFVCGRGSE